MALTKLPIRPGVVKDDPEYQSEGVYVDSQWARFWRGLPEKIGGWVKYVDDTFTGKCRGLLPWRDNTASPYIGIGTHTGLFVATTTAVYDITPVGFSTGQEYGTTGVGWGAGVWSHAGGWGSATPVASVFPPTVWTLAPFGQDLIAAPKGGKLYKWSRSVTTPAAEVSGAPTNVGSIFVTQEGFVVLVGATSTVTGTFDPMLVRWSSQRDETTWSASATNTAGDYSFSGTRLVAGTPSRYVNLIWSDDALHSMRYLGDIELVFGFELLGRNCGLISPHAFVEKDGMAFWMAPNEQFYVWDGGSPRPLDCTVRSFVFDAIVDVNKDAIYAGINAGFNEVWWFYPTGTATDDLNRYVIYNWVDNTWATGAIDRTSWADPGATTLPVSTGTDGYLYLHESGVNGDGAAIPSHVETAPFDIGDGDRVMKIGGIIPDATITGAIDVTLTTKRYPQGADEYSTTKEYTSSDVRIDLHAEGRQAKIKVASDAVGDDWRLGNLRLNLKPGGKR